MKYMLLKHKSLKLLINEGLQIQPLLDRLPEIERLADKVSAFYKDAMTATKGQGQSLETEKAALISKIGYKIIGVPFSNHDAELYALDKKLDYEVLELHGNTGNQNALGELPADTQLQIRLNSQLKAGYVKQSQREGMKLSRWVIKTLSAASAREG